MTTRVFIIPAALRDAGNAMAEAMGWGGPVFVQPLSADGQEPITHWGFPAVVGPEFVALWADPPEDAADLVAAVDIDTREGDDTAAHWRAVLDELGLQAVLLPRPVDINHADSETLQSLDGVGEALAGQIIAGRPWADPADLSQISGISTAMVQGWMEAPGLVAGALQ